MKTGYTHVHGDPRKFHEPAGDRITEARDTLKDRVCGILTGTRSLDEIDEKIDALIAAVRRHERTLASQADRE